MLNASYIASPSKKNPKIVAFKVDPLSWSFKGVQIVCFNLYFVQAK